MGNLIQDCPLGAQIASVPEASCPEIFGQIAKVAFQKIQSVPSFTDVTIKLKATWTPLFAEVDETKMVLSPFINNFVIPKSEVIAEGGNDNTTINGVRNVKGLGMVTPTGNILNIPETVKAALQKLFMYSRSPMPGATLLWAYFITSDGKVIYKNAGEGFPVYNVVVTDPGSEGLLKDNEFGFSMDLAPYWSDGFKVAKTDIVPVLFVNP